MSCPDCGADWQRGPEYHYAPRTTPRDSRRHYTWHLDHATNCPFSRSQRRAHKRPVTRKAKS